MTIRRGWKIAGRATLGVVIGIWASVAAAQQTTDEPYGVAVLNALDKITGRVSEIEAAVDEPVEFGTLSITARACYATPPEEAPESKAFLEVVDHRPGAAPEPVFSGWMFASSPSVSAMEHPVYDVWVIACKAALPEMDSGKAQ